MSVNTVVLDIGSHAIKAGLGSQSEPQMVLPSLSGTFKYKPIFSTMMQYRQIPPNSTLVGKDLEKYKGVVKLQYPIRYGLIQDWKSSSLLIQHALQGIFESTEGGTAVSSSSSVCYALVEHPFASRVQRRKVVEELFEYANHQEVHGVFIGVSPLLALYSSGQLTGVGVDIGEGQISTAAAVRGFSLTGAMQREDGVPSGGAVTMYLESLLRMYGACERRSGAIWPILGSGTIADREIVRGIKERRCEVSPTPLSPTSVSPEAVHHPMALAEALESSAKQHQKYPPQLHRLPDGSEIEVGVEAWLAPEVLFSPGLMNSDARGVPEVVFSSVAQADIEARADLLGHVVISGSTTLLSGFGARFLQEMLQRVPRENKVRVVAPAERGYAPWLGAAFLSQLSTFASDMVVTKAQYDEVGESAFQSKLFA